MTGRFESRRSPTPAVLIRDGEYGDVEVLARLPHGIGVKRRQFPNVEQANAYAAMLAERLNLPIFDRLRRAEIDGSAIRSGAVR